VTGVGRPGVAALTEKLEARLPELAPDAVESLLATLPRFGAAVLLASKGIGSMLVAPYVIGVVLGVPLIGTLLERRTAMLVWSMTPSRRRWLIGQITCVALVTVLAITPPALAADVLERVSYPQYQADASFNDYGQRGLLPVAVATAALSVSVLTGLIVGRTLPGVLVAGALCLGLFFAPTVVRPHLAPLDVLDRARVDSDAMQLGAGWRRPDGRVLTLGEAAASSPFATGTPEQQSWIQDHYELVVLGFSPARYGDVVLRESLLLFGLAGGVAGASLAIVGRRRPY
jgi:hypothetical protein